MDRFPPRRFLAALAAVTLGAVPAGAQTVRGVALEEGTESRVEGAIVSLIDEAGETRALALTDVAGAFRVHVPRPGAYRLRIERIGYATLTSAPLRLARGQVHEGQWRLPVEAVELSSVEVSVSDPCATRPDAAERLGAVWGEARKALEAARLSRRGAGREFEWVRTERRLDPRSQAVLDERVTLGTTLEESPFRTRPADEIAADGWATVYPERIHYFGPDVEALLSDWFLDDHCFRLVRDEDRIGLAFRPLDRRDRVELEGVLWLDEATAELRTLEFRYVGLPYELAAAMAGGEARFARLEDGRWILSEWTLRAPELELESRQDEGRVLSLLETRGHARPRGGHALPRA